LNPRVFVLFGVLLAPLFGQRPPHIVVILADDLGIGDLGCFNPDSKIPTPNCDELAAAGIRLTDMHSPSAVCTPTRYGLLTGRYCWRTRLRSGVLDGDAPLLIEAGRMTLASLLAARGYATACIGKWHLGLGDATPTDYAAPLSPGPRSVGFERFFGVSASLDMPPYAFIENERVVAAPTERIAASTHRRQGGDGFWRAGAIAPGFRHGQVLDAIVDQAIAFLAEKATTSPRPPVFLYVPLTAPHTPWLPTEAFRGRSKAGWYGDFVAQVDDSIGRIVAALDRLGYADDTLLIVTSDNGAHWPAADIERFGHRANLGHRGQKADIHEGGHRVPFVARWPGRIPRGTTSDALSCLTDLFATCAAIVGHRVPVDAGEDSFDLLPALCGRDPTGPTRTALVSHSLHGMFAIREGRWKLVLGRGSGGFTAPRVRTDGADPSEPPAQLYDLVADPGETSNRFDAQPEVVARLESLLDQYRESGRSTPVPR
jgi:arylsulfatase A-like enzyme